MYYVGKLFSNVKGLYNEINPATLTGAIDVIVVRQKDGTYTTSPWHVRFGKMSVIRTREKVVDIEINGEPADLHMKLGEAGEAFFVQETDDTFEVPAYLATSPISPGLIEMEAGLAALKVAIASGSCTQEEPLTPVIEQCGTGIRLEDGKRVVPGIPPPMLLADDRQYFSDSDATMGSALLSRRRRQRESVSTQTNLLSTDIEYINVDFGRPSTPPGEWYSGLLTDVQTTKSCLEQQQTVACSLPTVGHSLPSTQVLKTKLKSQPLYTSVQAGKVIDKSLSGGVVSAEDCQFEMDLSDDERALSPIFKMPDSADLGIVGRCISMPIIRQSDDYDNVDMWATKQYATTAMHGYADITPTTSPVNSRPISPLSDSEIVNMNRDATSQTLLTGSRLTMVDDVKWQWGEFPESSSAHRLSLLAAAAAASEVSSVTRKVEEDGAVGDVITQTEKDTVVESLMSELTSTLFDTRVCDNSNSELLAEPSSSPSDLVETCHATPAPEPKKASSKKPCSIIQEKGIYLEDLTQDEPELAALYLYNRKSNSPPRLPILKDEDSESGRGASLPQSPVTVEVECRDTSDTSCQKKFSLSCSLTGVALSLCGPLDHEDTVISEERFNQCLVTYDVLMENPNVLSDPNLIVKVDGRFYNWAVAAPIIMSSIAFKKPLSETCMSRLISQHLPKKESSSGGVWQRLWGRGKGKGGGTGTSVAVSASSPPTNGKESGSAPSSHQTSPPNTPQKCNGDNKSSTSNVESVVTCEDEGDVLVMPETMPVTIEEIKASRDESPSGHAHIREKCRKSLKLTSDEIARLNLKDGVNEVTFSVTTQYQGTTKCQCYVYLWQWDDRIIVSDIDGTITKSDVLGQVLPMIGSVLPYISTDWSQAGIAQLYQMISRNNYKFLYLSARAIGQSKLTRDYLRGVRQSDIHLPDGPLLLSPSSLMSAFHKEVIERKPEQFKISCLRDISALFPPTENPFIAGFGNKINDVWAYREVGIPLSRIFTVNHKGELRMDSTQAFQSSYKRLSDIVDHLFPPRPSHVDESLTVSSNFNSFSYWRSQVPLLDTAVVNEFIKNRDAAAAADKSSNAKKAAVKKPVSAAVSAPATGNIKSNRKTDGKSVAK